ncbi:MAG: aldo/keto reductase [Solibacterales bacterium]|nr:aldo/keto reductase [Bryobacterales bacterium]
MELIRLPHTDLVVSQACMGTMTFGSQADKSESCRIVDICLDAGINFFDTANVYNQGLSEEILGSALGAKRSKVVLADKVRGKMDREASYSGLSRTAIRQSIDESLTRLGTDYLDIYYLHQPDYDTSIEETLETLESLRLEGKIRYSGTSNYSAWQLCEILWLCEKNGYQPPWVSQPMYNLLARGIEQEYLPFTEQFEIGVVAYNPLAGGLLTGKHSHGQSPVENTRFEGGRASAKMYRNRYWHEDYFQAVEKLKVVAQQNQRSLIELAFTWVFSQKSVDVVILGASSSDQLKKNLQTLEVPHLNDLETEQCNEIWQHLRGSTPSYNR